MEGAWSTLYVSFVQEVDLRYGRGEEYTWVIVGVSSRPNMHGADLIDLRQEVDLRNGRCVK